MASKVFKLIGSDSPILNRRPAQARLMRRLPKKIVRNSILALVFDSI
jgi:hypothetical protein